MDSLPPEIIARIVYFSCGDDAGWPRRTFSLLTSRTVALLSLSKVNRSFRLESQRLLFGFIVLQTQNQAESWITSPAHFKYRITSLHIQFPASRITLAELYENKPTRGAQERHQGDRSQKSVLSEILEDQRVEGLVELGIIGFREVATSVLWGSKLKDLETLILYDNTFDLRDCPSTPLPFSRLRKFISRIDANDNHYLEMVMMGVKHTYYEELVSRILESSLGTLDTLEASFNAVIFVHPPRSLPYEAFWKLAPRLFPGLSSLHLNFNGCLPPVDVLATLLPTCTKLHTLAFKTNTHFGKEPLLELPPNLRHLTRAFPNSKDVNVLTILQKCVECEGLEKVEMRLGQRLPLEGMYELNETLRGRGVEVNIIYE